MNDSADREIELSDLNKSTIPKFRFKWQERQYRRREKERIAKQKKEERIV